MWGEDSHCFLAINVPRRATKFTDVEIQAKYCPLGVGKVSRGCFSYELKGKPPCVCILF